MNQEPNFQPHPNLSKEINDAIADSELQGGVFLKDLSVEATLQVKTKNSTYTIQKRGGEVFAQGGKYMPEFTKVNLHGSTWGGSMLKVGFIGRGMHLELSFPGDPRTITTSRIEEVTEL